MGDRLHHPGASQVLAGVPERVHQRVRRGHAVDVVDIGQSLAAVVLLQDRPEERHRLVLLPLRVERVLEEGDRDRALRLQLAARQAGDRHRVRRARDRVDEDERAPSEHPRRRVGLDRELRRREHHQRVDALRLQPRDLRLDVGVGDVVALLRDDQLRPLAERVLEAGDELLPVVVVLVEDPDPGIRPRLRDVVAVDRSLAPVPWLEADRPRILLVVASPGAPAARDQELRDLQLVQVRADREVLLRTERVVDREDLVVLDEVAGLLDRLRRIVGVVVVLVLDAPAEDAAVVVDVLEVGVGPLRDRRVGGGRTAERRRPADQDLLRGHPGRAGAARRCGGDDHERSEHAEEDPGLPHSPH